jgi:opacity protein-like surface antigen
VNIGRILALTLVLFAACLGTARAEGFITPFFGFNFGGDSSNCATLTTCEDKRTNYGVTLGNMGTIFGIEEDLGWAKDFFGKVPGADNSVFSAMTDLLIGIGAGPVQPYGLAGLGVIRSHTSLSLNQFSSDKTALGYDIGGGVHVYFSKHVGIRGDIRHLHTLQDVPIFSDQLSGLITSQKLNFFRASIGVSFK